MLLIFSGGSSTIVLGALLNVFDKNTWYCKWYIWVIGFVLVLPFAVMLYTFQISLIAKTAAKLDVKGKDYYLSPYVWIILIIIPFIGWIIFGILYFYLIIDIIVKLHDGNGEKYIG